MWFYLYNFLISQFNFSELENLFQMFILFAVTFNTNLNSDNPWRQSDLDFGNRPRSISR